MRFRNLILQISIVPLNGTTRQSAKGRSIVVTSRRALLLVVCVCCLAGGSGCLRNYCESRGVSGKLIDADSGKPIAGEPVRVTVDGHQNDVVSSSGGEFDVKPTYRMVPWIMGDWAWGPPSVGVAPEGYAPFASKGTWDLRVDKDYVLLGELRLKRQGASSPESSR